MSYDREWKDGREEEWNAEESAGRMKWWKDGREDCEESAGRVED